MRIPTSTRKFTGDKDTMRNDVLIAVDLTVNFSDNTELGHKIIDICIDNASEGTDCYDDIKKLIMENIDEFVKQASWDVREYRYDNGSIPF